MIRLFALMLIASSAFAQNTAITRLNTVTKVAGVLSTSANTFCLKGSISGCTPVNAPAIADSTAIILQDFKASGINHIRGLVPDPGASAGTTKFLREDATWAVTPGGENPLTFSTGLTRTVDTITANAVNLAASGSGGVTGNLPIGNLASGTGATNLTYWRGDGTWAAPEGTAGSGLVDSFNTRTGAVGLLSADVTGALAYTPEVPLTFSTGLTRTTNTITANAVNLAATGSGGATGTLAAGRFPALTGDVTTTAGSIASTLATVNSNVGSFGSATQAGVFTVNAKGLVTAASASTVTPAVGSITGLGSGVATFLATPTSANLIAATGALALGTPASGVATNLTGTAAGLTAGAATTLATARTINGTSFNGSANITVTAPIRCVTSTMSGSVTLGTGLEVTCTATGATSGMVAHATWLTDPGVGTTAPQAWVSATNTVKVRICGLKTMTIADTAFQVGVWP